jgi:hypothetical protein
VQLVSPAQELDPGHARQPLVGEQQRDLLAGLAEPPERVQAGLRGRRRDDLVVGPEPAAEVALQSP